MKLVDTVITARWVVPVEPLGVLDDHAVVVDGGQIVDVLPRSHAGARYDSREHVHLGDHVLVPGFVNAHTHAAMTLLRGIADDLPLMTWLRDHIWPTEARWTSPEFVRDGTRLAVAEMLQAGVTTFNDMYFFPETAVEVAVEAGIRMVAGMICFDQPTAYSANADECLRKGIALHQKVEHLELVTTMWAPHGPYTVSDEPWRAIAELADELNVGIHTHLHETITEVDDSMRQHGIRPIQRLDQLGVVTSRLVAAHMTQVNTDESGLFARAGASVVHCPESNLKLASGFCPVNELLRAGVNVALGTDGAASNNDADILAEVRLAALLAKAVAGDAAAVPATAALRMATLAGAQALGLADRIGSIEIGKSADLTAVDLSDLSHQPMYEPVSQLIYTTNRSQVSDVWVAGRRKVQCGALVDLDPDELRATARMWQQRITG